MGQLNPEPSRRLPPILLDVTRLVMRRLNGRLPTGVDRVGLSYVRHYEDCARALLTYRGRSIVLPERGSPDLFRWLLSPPRAVESAVSSAAAVSAAVAMPAISMRAAPLPWRAAVRSLFARNSWPTRAVPLLLNTGHSGLQHSNYAAAVRRAEARAVFFIHDLIPITHPEYARAGEQARHTCRMEAALRWAAGLITNSQATLDELTRWAQHRGLRRPPAVVAPLASGIASFSPGPRPVQAPYFVALGTIEPRKNHLLLLQIWRRLVEQLGSAAPRLVIIGQRGWENEQVVDLLERCEALRGFVDELPHCTDERLVTYLGHAQALLLPSLAEGFGLPLVEALSLRVPVIASNLPAFREIVGDIPDYADPLDGPRWMELIRAYAYADTEAAAPHRAAQIARMQAFRAPSWEAHYEIVDAFLADLYAA
jgi:glycosyltransferase involved in cell wall biosynthesis